MGSFHSSYQDEMSIQLDLTQLNLMAADDPGFRVQVLQMLHGQTSEMKNVLSTALKDADWGALADASHKFKSSVFIVSRQAHDHFNVLEKEAREAKKSQLLEAMTENAIRLCSRLISSFEEELKK